ncbi:J domain-containing protein [Cyanobacterium aponinum]|uniref:Heat shock protein DnaJ domain protein n=1 Tax=Cyanobacterium aponinum (strain PCC 10605) TaxID=755178 RepID=K9Z8C4_CYAAP|nr:DnaJ domain-containing protein [Cyanobacterium aponinum]AFZ54982.1 heat shock protein DnaJ domain protein [Cyanobacterium aponinum PCC 10605]
MNYYEILEIKHNASAQEIKQAYRRLAKKFHPDSQNNNADHEKIVSLNAAYEILSDPENRHIYDQTLKQNRADSVQYRHGKSNSASEFYRYNRQQQKDTEFSQFQWLQEVYFPVKNLINSIVSPLEMEIEELSADIFDDELMSFFMEYLENCQQACNQAQNILTSQKNPSLYAGIAANLYYGLNHLNDGLEELNRFTQTYDESYLHTGRELFYLAEEINQVAEEMAEKFI